MSVSICISFDFDGISSWSGGARMLMLERLLDHMANAKGVVFRTMEDVAAEFRARAMDQKR